MTMILLLIDLSVYEFKTKESGLVVNYDTRNSLFYPTQGWLLEGQLYTEGEYSDSDFDYQKIVVILKAHIEMKTF